MKTSRLSVGLFLASCVGSSLILPAFVSSEFLEAPRLRWTFNLEDDSPLRQGNTVVPWRRGGKLFVTAADGSLHILDVSSSSEASTIAVFQPNAVGSTSTECKSGVLVVDSELLQPTQDGQNQPASSEATMEPYLVYAVTDTSATSENAASSSSRVFGVNMDGSVRWTVVVDGQVQGSPVIGSDGRTFYISRNVGAIGLVSVIKTNDQGGDAEVVASIGRDAPLGPPALGTSNEGGFSADFVVVAENKDDGFVQEGSVHVLVPSEEFQNLQGRGNGSYEFRLISSTAWPYSTVMAPLVQGTNLFIGGFSSIIAGFADNGDISEVLRGRRDDVFPRWQIQLQPSAENVTQPLLATPALSSDGSVLCQPGASNLMICLDADRGRDYWTVPVDSTVVTQPIFSEVNEQSMLYFIESSNGRVRQFDVVDGFQYWEFSCSELSGVGGCQDSVEAEFSVSPSGNVLYYGDVSGQIVALEVGEFETQAPTADPSQFPTIAPSSAPSSSMAPTESPSVVPSTGPTVFVSPVAIADPTDAPVASPTAQPAETLDPAIFDQTLGAANGGDDSDSSGLSLAVLLGAVAGGLFVLIAVGLFLANAFFTPKKKSRKATSKIIAGDVANDLEAGSSSGSEGGDYDVDDAVTVNSGNGDSMEVEVTAGSNLYGTPKSKTRKSRSRRKSKARTPPTPATLESIVEADDEEVYDMDDGGEGQPRKNLDKQFVSVALEDSEDEDNISVDSDATPPPPPPQSASNVTGKTSQNEEREVDADSPIKIAYEEKKDDEESEYSPFTPDPDARPLSPEPSLGRSSQPSFGLSPQPSLGMHDESLGSPGTSATADQSIFSAFASVLSPSEPEEPSSPDRSAISNRSGPPSPPRSRASSPEPSAASLASEKLSPGVMSTDSSLYTDDKSGIVGNTLSPLSPHLLSKRLDEEELPDDEFSGTPNHQMLQPSLSHNSNERDFYTEEAPEDERLRGPGAHYISSASSLRPRFTPSHSNSPAQGVKSVRTKKNLNGFAPSSLNETVEQKKSPSFKRRNKKEETSSPDEPGDDTWSSFLRDLAAAEQQFFSPTHSQKSAVLRYNGDADDERSDLNQD